MAVDPESMLGTPSNYASPEQLAMARQLAAALMRPQQGQFMQSWTQPAAQIVNALLGVKLMNQANAQQRATAAAGLGYGSPLSQPGPGPQASAAPTGDEYADASNYVKRFEGFDPVSKWDFHQYTSGYGTKEPRGAGIPISQDEAQSRFDAEFSPIYSQVKARFPNASPDQLKALSSLTMNAGPGWMQGSGLSRAVDANNWPEAARHMLGYNQAGGATNPTLVHRRQVDAQMLLSGAARQTAEGGPVRMDAPSVPAAGMSIAPPSSPAGAQTQPPVSPTGQPPQATPGLSMASPVQTGGPPQGQGGPPPQQLFRQPLITRDMVYTARLSQDPMASKLMEMYLQQQQPQIVQYGDAFYSYIPARPDIPPTLVPQPSKLEKEGGGGVPEYYSQFKQTPQGYVRSPIGQAGQPGGAPPTTSGAASPPQGGGEGGPSQGIQAPTDFASAAKAAVDITGQKKQAELDATTHNKIYNGIIGKGVNAAEQQQNIQLAKAIMEDPGYQVGGTGANLRQSLKGVLATMGLDPNAATPRKLVDMLGARILQQQLASLRSSTSEMGEQAGRIFATQVAIEEKALLNSDDPDPVIRAKLNILDQEARLSIAGAKMAHEYHSSHGGRIDSDFVNQYIENISKQRMSVPPRELTPEDTSRVGGFAKPLAPGAPSGGFSGFRRID